MQEAWNEIRKEWKFWLGFLLFVIVTVSIFGYSIHRYNVECRGKTIAEAPVWCVRSR